MAKRNNRGTPNDNTPEDSDGSPKNYARWEDVPAKIREKIDERFARYKPAPTNKDGSIAWDELKEDDPRGRLNLASYDIDAAVLTTLLREKRSELLNVTELNLRHNAIGPKGAAALAAKDSPLGNLTTLHLQDNAIGDEGAAALAAEDSPLGSLTTLYLGTNAIGPKGALALAAKDSPLSNLTTLYLSYNAIGDEGATALAAKDSPLGNLITLSLHYNNITDASAIVEIIQNLGTVASPGRKLEKIAVGGNPLKTTGGVAIESSGLKLSLTPVGEMFQFLTAAMAKDAFVLREARVVLVGVGGNGKSQLAGALGKQLTEGEKATPYTKGLEIVPYDVEVPASETQQKKTGKKTITYHTRLLDVGGQAEQFSMHRLIFDRKRNAMMLVCSAIKPWDWTGNRGSYFLKMLQTVSAQKVDDTIEGQMPTIGVVTMSDCVIDRHPMQTSPATIRQEAAKLGIEIDVVDPAVDALNQKMQGAANVGLKPVEDAITRAVTRIPETVIGKSFEAVRDMVRELFGTFQDPKTDVHEIKLTRYVEDAITAGAETEGMAMQYLGVMHSLGDVVYFTDNDKLNDRVMNIHWAREAMYRLLTSDTVKRNRGLMTEVEWKDIAKEDRTDTLTDIMIEQALMHRADGHDHTKGRNTSNWLVPDMLGYSPSPHAWTEITPVRSARFGTFLWETTLLQFIGTHAQEVIGQIKEAYRDQVMLERSDKVRVIVRADYDSNPMAIRFYKDPTDKTKKSAAWCQELVKELKVPIEYGRSGTGPNMTYPHPKANPAIAQKHIHIGIGYYAKQQRIRALIMAGTIVLAVSSAFATALFKSTPWAGIVLGVLSVFTAIATILTDFLKMREDCKKGAVAFKCADTSLIDGEDPYVDPNEEAQWTAGEKEAPDAKPDNWFVDIAYVTDAERWKLLAAMQEARFRSTEHRSAAMWAFIFLACSVFVPFFLMYAITPERTRHIEVGFLPFCALAIACLITGLRNLDSFWAFNKLHASCVEHHNRYSDNEETLDDLQEAGELILNTVQMLRQTRPPVSKTVYKRNRVESNLKCKLYATLFRDKEKLR